MRVYAYVRVSTNAQDLSLQRSELVKACQYRGIEIIEIFEDIRTGKNIERPHFQRMISLLEANPASIDAVVVWKLDRIGRSIRDLINISDFFQKHNIGLIATSSNIDTTTKEGRLYFYMMSAFAEYERELIQERTGLGIAQAKADGKICHRPIKKVDMNQVNTMLAQGVPKRRIARIMNISTKTLYNRLNTIS